MDRAIIRSWNTHRTTAQVDDHAAQEAYRFKLYNADFRLMWDILNRMSCSISGHCGKQAIGHHSVILEFDLPSYRTSEAQSRQAEDETDRQN